MAQSDRNLVFHRYSVALSSLVRKLIRRGNGNTAILGGPNDSIFVPWEPSRATSWSAPGRLDTPSKAARSRVRRWQHRNRGWARRQLERRGPAVRSRTARTRARALASGTPGGAPSYDRDASTVCGRMKLTCRESLRVQRAACFAMPAAASRPKLGARSHRTFGPFEARVPAHRLSTRCGGSASAT
jgi:hypothetical protein